MDSFVPTNISVNFSNMLCVYGHFVVYGNNINIINMGVEWGGLFFGTSTNNALMKEVLLDNLKL
jgi:hypothetical protein